MNEPVKILCEALRAEIKEIIREVLEEIAAAGNGKDGEDWLLDAEEAGKLMSVSPEWFYKNWRKLPFAVKVHHKMLRFSHAGIQRFIASKRKGA